MLACAAVAAVLPVLARRLGPRVFYVGMLPLVAALVWGGWAMQQVRDGNDPTQSVSWVPSLNLHLDLRFDGFSFLMFGLVAGIGTLVFIYARSYFHPGPEVGRTAAILLVFGAAMLGLVVADNLLALFLFWELTSVTSFLLIGTNHEQANARAAAVQALLTTGLGSLAMLGGFVLLGQTAGTYSMSAIFEHPPTGMVVDVALVLVLAGALTKSAQVPFHAWLPGAMAAPTPISAYLHSATMVKAGVYLVARFAPVFALYGPWRPIVLTAGLASMILGGYRAMRQHDIKLLLAYGTVSQLGFMIVLFGIGTPEATFAGCILLIAHGTFKAALFMVVGMVDHQTHTRDLRRLDGLGRAWPVAAAAAGVAAASMAGVPPTLGFIAKEGALSSLGAVGTAVGAISLAGVVIGSIFTFAYSARFVWGAFGPVDRHHGLERRHVGADVARPATRFAVPAYVLAGATLIFGIIPALVNGTVQQAFQALWGEPATEHVALWHGFSSSLALSGLVLGAGALFFWGRARVERWQASLTGLPSAQRGYEGSLKGTLRGADLVTSVVQSGSLPMYLGVILLTVVALAGVPLLNNPTWPTTFFADSPLQVVVAVIMVACALASAITRRRFAAVLFVGAVGYGMAALFIIQGAPDLAITQLLIETLGVVVFVLVVRHLPSRFKPRPIRGSQIPRVLIAVVVAVFIFVFTLVAVAARQGPPISDQYMAKALPEGGGHNVVNVVVIDFRGFDTMGEITVLAVAALGVAAIVRATRRDEGLAEDDEGGPEPPGAPPGDTAGEALDRDDDARDDEGVPVA